MKIYPWLLRRIPVERDLLDICLKKGQIESCYAEAGFSPNAGMRCSCFQCQELSSLIWGTGAHL
jgi:hypothetical protein